MAIPPPPASISSSSTNSDDSRPLPHVAKRKRSQRRPRIPLPPTPTSDDELLAISLLMLSRDASAGAAAAAAATASPSPQKLDHACHVCAKTFHSHQALGGHMASHRKPVSSNNRLSVESPAAPVVSSSSAGGGRNHVCLICMKRFATGQALGGHKRKHYDGTMGSAVGAGVGGAGAASSSSEAASGGGRRGIELDLNLPPLVEFGFDVSPRCLGVEDEVESPLSFKKPHVLLMG